MPYSLFPPFPFSPLFPFTPFPPFSLDHVFRFEGDAESRYGAAVSLAGNGATVAIGAPDANGGGMLNGQADVIELVSPAPPPENSPTAQATSFT